MATGLPLCAPSSKGVSMTRQLTTLTLCLLLASCTTHKAEPARPAFDSSRNPDLLSPDLYPNGVQPEKEPVVRYGRYTLVSTQPDAGQRDLMAQIIDVTIPSSMNPSVKDAMQYVMSRSVFLRCHRVRSAIAGSSPGPSWRSGQAVAPTSRRGLPRCRPTGP